MPDDRVMPVLREPQRRRTRSNRKLLALLFLFFMTVLAILFFQSSLSKISKIQIKGNVVLSADAIGQASGVKVGDHFFGSVSGVIERRIAAMKMVQSVHVSKQFPGVITIEVKEYPKVAFQLSKDGTLEAVLADGSTAPLQNSGTVPNQPILTGWKDNDPLKAQLCRTLSQIPPAYLSDVSEIQPDPSNGFADKIKMYTRSQFVVDTTISFLPDKIERLQGIVNNLHENNVNSGVITMLLADSYEPLDSTSEAKSSDESGSKPPVSGNSNASADKPADKPANKPADKSADKPMNKPADKATDKPTVKPKDNSGSAKKSG